jgi:hypothetical protein
VPLQRTWSQVTPTGHNLALRAVRAASQSYAHFTRKLKLRILQLVADCVWNVAGAHGRQLPVRVASRDSRLQDAFSSVQVYPGKPVLTAAANGKDVPGSRFSRFASVLLFAQAESLVRESLSRRNAVFSASD